MDIKQIQERGREALRLTEGMNSYDALLMLVGAAYSVASSIRESDTATDDIRKALHELVDIVVDIDTEFPEPHNFKS